MRWMRAKLRNPSQCTNKSAAKNKEEGQTYRRITDFSVCLQKNHPYEPNFPCPHRAGPIPLSVADGRLRLIHTTYTLTVDGRLRIDRGRFSRRRERPLSDIVSVERASSMRVAGHALVSYVLVCYKDGKQDALQPVKEEEFIRSLTKRMAGDGPR